MDDVLNKTNTKLNKVSLTQKVSRSNSIKVSEESKLRPKKYLHYDSPYNEVIFYLIFYSIII